MTSSNKILVVEDSPIVSKIIRHVMQTDTRFEAFYASSFATAREVYDEIEDDVFLALVDLNLPDAPDGEVVDYLLDLGVPVIVLTGSFDEDRRTELLAKGIVDYVTKEGRYSYEYALGMINQLHDNQSIKVLVVDDSSTSRGVVTELLQRHQFQVLEANSGEEAIAQLQSNPDVQLLLTDYNMPTMDGFELVRVVRDKLQKHDMAIIGLSGDGQSAMSAKFIKNGADDFLGKPFNPEEFYCRVNRNLEILRQAELLRRFQQQDALTGLLNRQTFFAQAQALADATLEKQQPLSAVSLKLANFTKANFQFGMAGGDRVLQTFSGLLQQNFQRFLLGRASGDSFVILMPGLSAEKASALLSGLQQVLASQPLSFEQGSLVIEFHAGVSDRADGDVGLQFLRAEAHLHKARQQPAGTVLLS